MASNSTRNMALGGAQTFLQDDCIFLGRQGCPQTCWPAAKDAVEQPRAPRADWIMLAQHEARKTPRASPARNRATVADPNRSYHAARREGLGMAPLL